MTRTCVPVLAAIVVNILNTINGFPSGPPLTEFVCKDMFPVGHGVDAQFSEPPYSIELSQNVYTPWEELRVSVAAKPGHYIRGLFVQARRASCNHPNQKEPIGTFQLLPGEKYLQARSCLNRVNSSLSHTNNPGLEKAVFRWFAPAVRAGHIYFVATVVKERRTFWTTVYSEILRDLSLNVGASTCPARTLLDPNMPHTTSQPLVSTSTRDTSTSSKLAASLVLLISCVCLTLH